MEELEERRNFRRFIKSLNFLGLWNNKQGKPSKSQMRIKKQWNPNDGESYALVAYVKGADTLTKKGMEFLEMIEDNLKKPDAIEQSTERELSIIIVHEMRQNVEAEEFTDWMHDREFVVCQTLTREQIAERSQLIKKLIEEEKSKDAREIDPWHLLGLRCASDIYCNRMWRWEKNAAERAAKADRLAAELERERKTTELLREQTLDNEEKEVLARVGGVFKAEEDCDGAE